MSNEVEVEVKVEEVCVSKTGAKEPSTERTAPVNSKQPTTSLK